MSITDELEKLNRLRMEGALSELEFQDLKSNLIHGENRYPPASAPYQSSETNPGGMGSNINDADWCLGMHLSQFAYYIVPFAGVIAPIVMWQMKKDQSAVVDAHGRNIANWIITFGLGLIAFFFLCFVFIGIPLLFAWGICGVVFPIIGAVKAHKGEIWTYPLSFRFF